MSAESLLSGLTHIHTREEFTKNSPIKSWRQSLSKSKLSLGRVTLVNRLVAQPL